MNNACGSPSISEIKHICEKHLGFDCLDKDCYMCRHWCGYELVGYKNILFQIDTMELNNEK